MTQEFQIPADLPIDLTLDVKTVNILIDALSNYFVYNAVAGTIATMRAQMDNQCVQYLRTQGNEEFPVAAEPGQ